MNHWRFTVTALLLAATAFLLQGRKQNEAMPPRQPLESFPHQLGSWTGTDVNIPPDVREVLGSGDFLLRFYQNPSTATDVDLFVAYIPSQREGDTLHSPKNCLPGSGWSPVESSQLSISQPGQPKFPANRYVIAKGGERQLVLYWYWAHGRGVASEYWAKFYLIADSIRLHRSDGALVRVATPLLDGETLEAAQRRLLDFTGTMAPLLDLYVPR
ncbi:MAG TPA: EpsI family protein [Terriglobales bacterium]|nr:EpsI family protein [Terriglobales bacterium]